jgi:transposase
MLNALLSGTTDPEVLAELARGRLRSKLPALRDALEGCFSSHHALMVGKILAHVDYLDESIGDLSAEVERVIAAPFSEKVELLDTIPGVDRRMAETLIAEIGVDMSQFPTHRHLASWAGMCPGNEESAGKRRSGKTRKGSKWLRSALTESARAAARSLQGDLPCVALRPPQRPARFQESRRGGGALDPGDRLPRAGA